MAAISSSTTSSCSTTNTNSRTKRTNGHHNSTRRTCDWLSLSPLIYDRIWSRYVSWPDMIRTVENVCHGWRHMTLIDGIGYRSRRVFNMIVPPLPHQYDAYYSAWNQPSHHHHRHDGFNWKNIISWSWYPLIVLPRLRLASAPSARMATARQQHSSSRVSALALPAPSSSSSLSTLPSSWTAGLSSLHFTDVPIALLTTLIPYASSLRSLHLSFTNVSMHGNLRVINRNDTQQFASRMLQLFDVITNPAIRHIMVHVHMSIAQVGFGGEATTYIPSCITRHHQWPANLVSLSLDNPGHPAPIMIRTRTHPTAAGTKASTAPSLLPSSSSSSSASLVSSSGMDTPMGMCDAWTNIRELTLTNSWYIQNNITLRRPTATAAGTNGNGNKSNSNSNGNGNNNGAIGTSIDNYVAQGTLSSLTSLQWLLPHQPNSHESLAAILSSQPPLRQLTVRYLMMTSSLDALTSIGGGGGGGTGGATADHYRASLTSLDIHGWYGSSFVTTIHDTTRKPFTNDTITRVLLSLLQPSSSCASGPPSRSITLRHIGLPGCICTDHIDYNRVLVPLLQQISSIRIYGIVSPLHIIPLLLRHPHHHQHTVGDQPSDAFDTKTMNEASRQMSDYNVEQFHIVWGVAKPSCAMITMTNGTDRIWQHTEFDTLIHLLSTSISYSEVYPRDLSPYDVTKPLPLHRMMHQPVSPSPLSALQSLEQQLLVSKVTTSSASSIVNVSSTRSSSSSSSSSSRWHTLSNDMLLLICRYLPTWMIWRRMDGICRAWSISSSISGLWRGHTSGNGNGNGIDHNTFQWHTANRSLAIRSWIPLLGRRLSHLRAVAISTVSDIPHGWLSNLIPYIPAVEEFTVRVNRLTSRDLNGLGRYCCRLRSLNITLTHGHGTGTCHGTGTSGTRANNNNGDIIWRHIPPLLTSLVFTFALPKSVHIPLTLSPAIWNTLQTLSIDGIIDLRIDPSSSSTSSSSITTTTVTTPTTTITSTAYVGACDRNGVMVTHCKQATCPNRNLNFNYNCCRLRCPLMSGSWHCTACGALACCYGLHTCCGRCSSCHDGGYFGNNGNNDGTVDDDDDLPLPSYTGAPHLHTLRWWTTRTASSKRHDGAAAGTDGTVRGLTLTALSSLRTLVTLDRSPLLAYVTLPRHLTSEPHICAQLGVLRQRSQHSVVPLHLKASYIITTTAPTPTSTSTSTTSTAAAATV